jgi:hypothetical protein
MAEYIVNSTGKTALEARKQQAIYVASLVEGMLWSGVYQSITVEILQINGGQSVTEVSLQYHYEITEQYFPDGLCNGTENNLTFKKGGDK